MPNRRRRLNPGGQEQVSPTDLSNVGRARRKERQVHRPGKQHLAPDLTPRESEIAAWLTKGKTNREISLLSHVSVRTVEKHVERILQKLGVENRTAAVVALIDRQLL